MIGKCIGDGNHRLLLAYFFRQLALLIWLCVHIVSAFKDSGEVHIWILLQLHLLFAMLVRLVCLLVGHRHEILCNLLGVLSELSMRGSFSGPDTAGNFGEERFDSEFRDCDGYHFILPCAASDWQLPAVKTYAFIITILPGIVSIVFNFFGLAESL